MPLKPGAQTHSPDRSSQIPPFKQIGQVPLQFGGPHLSDEHSEILINFDYNVNNWFVLLLNQLKILINNKMNA